jgi:hypothetical protein
MTPVAMGLTGILADALDQNVPLIYVACGSTSALLSLVVSLSSEFRRFLAYEAGVNEQAVEEGGKEDGTSGAF